MDEKKIFAIIENRNDDLIYKKAQIMAEYLIKEMARKQGVTEELKATDMMRWIGLMNNIRACADEIVLNEIVYS